VSGCRIGTAVLEGAFTWQYAGVFGFGRMNARRARTEMSETYELTNQISTQ
jgi:hypothetical protein